MYLSVLMFGVFPPLLGHYFDASSMALGIFTAIAIIFLSNIYRAWLCVSLTRHTFGIILLAVLYSLLQHLFVGPWQSKSYLSLGLILVLFVFAKFTSYLIAKAPSIRMQWLAWINFTCVIIAILNFTSGYRVGQSLYGQNKVLFPFGEPSHFALFWGPFILLYMVKMSSSYKRVAWLSLTFLTAQIIGSVTLSIFSLLGSLLVMNLRGRNLISILVLLVPLSIYFIQSDYFIDRIVISENSVNLSALVYLQGLTDAKGSLIDTYGLGLGFQMLGTQPPSEISFRIATILGGESDELMLNREDGSFLAAKIVAEFGALGLVSLVLYMGLFIRTIIMLRAHLRSSVVLDSRQLLRMIFVYSIAVELFVRGVGYFSFGVLLFLTALLYPHENKYRN